MHRHPVKFHAQLVGDNLRHGGGGAMPLRVGAHIRHDAPGGIDPDMGEFGREMAEAHGGRLQRDGKANAEITPGLACFGLLGTEGGQVDLLQHGLETFARGDTIHHRAGDHGEGQIGGGDEVAAAQLLHRNADLPGGELHHRLARQRFHRPGAAIGRLSHGVAVIIDVLAAKQRHMVRAGQKHVDQRVAVDAVRKSADVAGIIGLRRQNFGIGIEGEAAMDFLLARLVGGGQVLQPVLDPLDRLVDQQGGGGHGGLLAPELRFQAKGAAHILGNHANVRLRQVEGAGEEVGGQMRALAGEVDQQGIDALPRRDDTARFHRDMRLTLVAQGGLHHMRGRGEGGIQRRVLGRVGLIGNVGGEFGVDGRAAAGIRHGDNGRFHRAIHENQPGGILGDIAIVGDNENNRLADVANLIARQTLHFRHRPPSGIKHHDLGLDGIQILRGEHGAHAGDSTGRLDIDAADLPARHLRAHEGRLQHAGQGDVIDKAAMPGEQALVFLAGQALADKTGGGGRGGGHGHAPAPASA